MPIRRTSIDSNQDTGFYTPEVYSNVGSRIINVQQSNTFFDFEAFPYEWFDNVYLDWVP